jgi:hypothetical protein
VGRSDRGCCSDACLRRRAGDRGRPRWVRIESAPALTPSRRVRRGIRSEPAATSFRHGAECQQRATPDGPAAACSVVHRCTAPHPGADPVTALESAGKRRERGLDLLRARFGERLRELLPAGELLVSQPVFGRDAKSLEETAARRLTWVEAGRSVEFETWVELTPSLTKLQALPESDLHLLPIPVLLAPHLTLRARLRLERTGWSYFTTSGAILIQHHDPLIAIRISTARPTIGDERARPAHLRRVADPRGRQ